MADDNIGPLPPSSMGLGNLPSSDLKVKNTKQFLKPRYLLKNF